MRPTRRILLSIAGALFGSLGVAALYAAHGAHHESTCRDVTDLEIDSLLTAEPPFHFSAAGITHEVYAAGSGPPVLLLHELPGMTPDFLRLASRIERAGFRVYMPLFFGHPNHRSDVRGFFVGIGREWQCLRAAPRPPILRWLRALIDQKVRRSAHQKIAIFGNCLSGGIPLALVDDDVEAVVLSQPACPFGLGPINRKSGEELGLSDSELANARKWSLGHSALLFRFTQDKISPGERFHRLQKELHLDPVSREIPSGPETDFDKEAHAVFTGSYRCEDEADTRTAFEAVLDRFNHLLRPAP